MMPGMDGIAFLKEVRRRYGDIPFILFTGRGREEVVIEAINNGADFYLQKGGNPTAQFAELSHKIRIAVEGRQTARALAESEQNYRSLVDLAPLAVIVCQKGKMVYVNPEASRLAGAESPADLTGRDFLPMFPPEGMKKIQDCFRQLERGETVPLTEITLVRPDGQIFTVEAAAKPIIYEGIPSVMIVCQDISDRKKRDEELRESREQLQDFMESATDAFTIWDADLNLVSINRAGLAYIPPAVTKEDLLGKNIADFMSGHDEWGMIERYREVIRTGVPFSGTSKKPQPQFGHRWVDVKCFRVGSGLGITTRDVTREKETEEELRDQCDKVAGRTKSGGETP
jgi:PAS domain S-box-containing protein